ncbi:hypothetical protein X777_09181 [Ooceraea biroi]|uniref:Uncharacterized protein n=1 Tax=Ooceraea biroi TaxID=2015173 RepID=A0A026W7B0_OOCBI|nr:hypothetical protein X777_09181 [Ooceraea biroi]
MNGGCGTCSLSRHSVFQNEIAAEKNGGKIPSKFDPRKVSGISRIAVVNSGCKCARAHAVRIWILSTRLLINLQSVPRRFTFHRTELSS